MADYSLDASATVGAWGRIMSLWCRFKGHVPRAELVWNEGRHFSTCRRCGTAILRGRTMQWRAPAEGERIIQTDEGLPVLLRG